MKAALISLLVLATAFLSTDAQVWNDEMDTEDAGDQLYEYENRRPDPRGDEEYDWEPPVRRLRERDGWGYGNDFKGPCRKQKLPWGAPFYVKGAHCDRRADRYTFYGCSDYKCQACTRNTWNNLGKLSPATRRIIKC